MNIRIVRNAFFLEREAERYRIGGVVHLNELGKKLAAREAVRFIRDGMVVGLGTGSTVKLFLRELCDWLAEGNRIVGIPTSLETKNLAERMGIRLSTLAVHPTVDVVIDGADEVNPQLNLIKGLGGALLLEKIVWSAAKVRVCIVDDSKLVEKLGTKSPLPVEIMNFGSSVVIKKLSSLDEEVEIKVREKEGEVYITDSGNIIVDCVFPKGIEDPYSLESRLNLIPGVVDNGLFLDMCDHVIVGYGDRGEAEVITKNEEDPPVKQEDEKNGL